jgi:elongation factor P hydroxylase
MWYLGAWYDPDNLQTPNASNFEVISPKAYTQGWALKVAQAHPMGFSEMQFGYWTRPPNPRGDFIG